MGIFRRNLERVAQRLTRSLGARWGESFPFWYVSEYPKAGGTWLAQMTADYLELPRPVRPVLPVGHASVLINHWRYHPGLKRCFYIYRDGRDVMVSFYFHYMRLIRNGVEHGRHFVETYERILGRGYDPDDSRKNLPRFIEHAMTPKRLRMPTWPEHIAMWVDRSRDHIQYLSYEALVRDTRETLRAALARFLDGRIDEDRLSRSIERYSFQRRTGRAPGQEDRLSFLRRGKPGDWVNHFTPEAAQLFDHYAGETLVRLGYEPDRSWVVNIPAISGVQVTVDPSPPAGSR
jgi:hypothetical protein